MAETYGIGSKFDESQELSRDNDRFVEKVSKTKLPKTVRKAWIAGEAIEEDPALLEKKALLAKRTKLKFSGLSL